jgi:hypothetical protein
MGAQPRAAHARNRTHCCSRFGLPRFGRRRGTGRAARSRRLRRLDIRRRVEGAVWSQWLDGKRRGEWFSHRLTALWARCDMREQVENLTLAVHRSPEPELLAADHCGHLVEMPLRGRAKATAAKLPSKKRSELQDPAPDRLVGNVETPFREELLDVAIAEREPGIQPHCVPDDRRRKLVTSERDGCHLPS